MSPPSRSLCLAAIILTTLALTGPLRALSQERHEPLHAVLPEDAIRAIDRPTFVPAARARLAKDELVIGLVSEDEQRAYSTWQLDRHEIVNDVFAGQPIAVTW